ncbi:hypothetical protein C8R44DRAFT_869570 [Mycena epipterygia]|nr:hypothetical protein C8R44DRAFT_869570 [Mycena epipterygia]
MPVLTRRMRRDAGLPDLPARFPLDVPNISRPQPHVDARGKRRPAAVPRSTLPLFSPTVLSSPTRFDSPSPLTSFTSESSESSQRSSRSYSTASTATRFDDPVALLPELHPGVRTLQRKSDEKWVFLQDGQSVRLCMPSPEPQRHQSPFGREWDILSAQTDKTSTLAAASPRSRSGSVSSSDATIRGTQMSSRTPSFAARPDKTPRVSRTNKKPGVSRR